MSTITKQEVAKIAKLAHLALTEDEMENFTGQLSAILTYMEKLNELDTNSVAAMSHSTLAGNTDYALRQDVRVASLPQSAALANAPVQGEGHFQVPKVIG
jgi:aspartyl-tRNA(Asn)/glutamyl-tRNA(Gln) amidotransferase subunit C